jgi:two-component system response regulator
METTMVHTVLIVDDNTDDIAIAKRILSKLGRQLKVESAPRGETALEQLRSEKDLPALILLDLKMPGMSGIDVLHEIRSDERLKRIPVVIVTCSALESDVKEAYASGADSFLHKAFDIDQFSEEIKHVLERWLKK